MGKTIAAKVDAKLYANIKDRAKRQGKSVSEYVKEALERANAVSIVAKSGEILCPDCLGVGIRTVKPDYYSLLGHLQADHAGSAGRWVDSELLRYRIESAIGFVRQMESTI